MVITRFGGPEVLEPRDLPVPAPGPGQVRVAVHACGTNRVDAAIRRSGAWAGIRPPAVPGYDVSGVVDAVGDQVEDFAVGDQVFYTPEVFGQQLGGYADYHVVDAHIVARKPARLSHQEAAAVPLAGGTAYETVVRRLAVQAGESILIHGAAGGVGSFAVQLAARAGASVIASASARHHDLLRELGAAACVDYTTQDVPAAAAAAAGGKLDAVADFVGAQTLAGSLPAVRPFGRVAAVVALGGDLGPVVVSNLTVHGVFLTRERQRLEVLRDLVEAGQLRPVVDEVLPLEDAAKAHERLDSGHGRGKVVLRVRAG